MTQEAQEFFGTLDRSNGAFKGTSVSDRMRHNLAWEEHERLQREGWKTATVVNLQNFDLTVNLGNMGTIRVPARKVGEPFVKYPISMYRLSMRDHGDAVFTPLAIMPPRLAEEVYKEYQNVGGVFWYLGDGEVPLDQLKDAEERMFGWYTRIYREAVDAWSRYRQHRMLTDRQKDAAHALFNRGLIDKLPEWVAATKSQGEHKMCPDCGEDKVKRAARKCRFCGYRFDGAPSDPEPSNTLPVIEEEEEHTVATPPEREKPHHSQKQRK